MQVFITAKPGDYYLVKLLYIINTLAFTTWQIAEVFYKLKQIFIMEITKA